MDTVYIVSHSHFDAEVFKTREDYLPWGYSNILDALSQLEQNPDYKYVLEQVCLVEPFLEAYPEMKEPIVRFIKERRLEITCGMYSMADVNMISGESLVRQLVHAQRFFREELGVTAQVGWLLDTFGLHKQVPQLMRAAGITSLVFFRVNPGDKAEFNWRSLDGTTLLTHWCSQSYGTMGFFPTDLAGFSRHIDGVIDRLRPYALDAYLLFEGYDLSAPRTDTTMMIKKYNQSPDRKYNLKMTTPSEFIDHVRSMPNLPTVDYDMNPVFQGGYSARIKVKQLNRSAENLFITTEALNAIAALSGQPDHQCAIDRAWRPVLFSQFHDVIVGCHIDAVYHNVIRRYNQGTYLAEEIRDDKFRHLLSRIDTRKASHPIVVYNPLSWRRTDVIEASISFAKDTAYSVSAFDSSGNEVPSQLEEIRYHENGAIREAKLCAIVSVPSLGYETLSLRENAPTGITSALSSSKNDGLTKLFDGFIENEYYRMEFDLWNGEIRSLLLKETGVELVDQAKGCFGAVIKQRDEGDFWEIDAPLRGGGAVPVQRIHPLPDHARATYSTDCNGYGSASNGPVKAVWTYTGKATGMYIETRITLYAGLRRIDFETTVLNQDERVRYRTAFPVTIRDGEIVREIPYGMTKQSEGELPSYTWTDYSDGKNGLAVLNCGLPGNAVIDDTLLLSLMRCVSYVQYSGGGYDPNTPAHEGHELGKTHRFSYSLLPHEGSWQSAGLARAGQERNNPLIIRKTVAHGGDLPPSYSFIGVEAENVIVSSFCARPTGAALRLYESQGISSKVRISLPWAVKAAYRTNLLEDEITRESVEVAQGGLILNVRAFEVITVVLEI